MTSPGDHRTWAAQFAEERARLLIAPRHVTDGGVIDQIIHVGATAIPGLWSVDPTITLAAAVWPLPLAEATIRQLVALGYEQVTRKRSLLRPISGMKAAPTNCTSGRLPRMSGLICSTSAPIYAMTKPHADVTPLRPYARPPHRKS